MAPEFEWVDPGGRVNDCIALSGTNVALLHSEFSMMGADA